MSVLLLKGTLFEKHIYAEQAHALYLARSADAHYRHILKVLTVTLANPATLYQDVIYISTTQALRHTIRTVQLAEAEYASNHIESPFTRAKNHMAKLTDSDNHHHHHHSNYDLSILSDLDGNDYLFKLTKIPAAVVMDKKPKEQDNYNYNYASYTDMYQRLV